MASATTSISSHPAALRDVKGDMFSLFWMLFPLYNFCSDPTFQLVKCAAPQQNSPEFEAHTGLTLLISLPSVRAAARIGGLRQQQASVAPSAAAARGQRARAVRSLRAAEPARQPVAASAAAAAPAAPVADEAAALAAVDYEALARELEGASPLEIMDRALAMFGSEIAIAFRCVTSSLVPLLNRDGFGSGTRYRVPVSLRCRWSSWNGFRRGDLHPVCSRRRGIFRTCGRTHSKWTRVFRWPLNCVSHLSASETARDH
jgi:hypothetical protein